MEYPSMEILQSLSLHVFQKDKRLSSFRRLYQELRDFTRIERGSVQLGRSIFLLPQNMHLLHVFCICYMCTLHTLLLVVELYIAKSSFKYMFLMQMQGLHMVCSRLYIFQNPICWEVGGIQNYASRHTFWLEI